MHFDAASGNKIYTSASPFFQAILAIDKRRLLGMVEATIEDLAFTIRSSRETIWRRLHIVG